MNSKSITPLPSADFTPEIGNYRTLQPFRYWCQKVLPLVYDDSLSYYELLCKVVNYLNKTMEDVETLHGDVTNLHTAYEQLQNYVNMYFSSLDVQQEINNKIDEMAENGTLNRLFGNELVMYDNINTPKIINMTKIGSFGETLSGHSFQGMCGDSNYLYLAHHTNDTANMWIMQVDRNSMSIVKDINTGATGHFNSMTLLNDIIYASGGDGTTYDYMAEISRDNLQLIKTVKLPRPYWSIYPAVIQSNYNPILCGFVEYSPVLHILTTRQNANKYTVFARYLFDAVDGIMQGGCVVNSALWQLFGSDYANYNNHNLICVYGLNGCYMGTFYLVTQDKCEGEDIYVTSPNGIIYMVDYKGNLYQGSLNKSFKQEFTNGFNIPASQPQITACYNPFNGSEEWLNGEDNVCTKFYLNPYTYATTNQMVGWAYLNSLKAPITFNPNTGTIDATTTYYIGNNKILFLYAQYTRISDETSYGYKLNDNSYISVIDYANNTHETKYGKDIINHSEYNGKWYLSYLV